jgi:hypothetical protein
MTFRSLVIAEFDFLVTDYGFRRVDHPEDSHDESPEYRKEPIAIRFGWGKGEIEIDFVVDLEFTATHPIFRPYISRTFYLSEIALRQDRNAFASWAARPGARDYVTSSDQAREFLVESARIMKQYCVPILLGDLKMLEEITKERRANA